MHMCVSVYVHATIHMSQCVHALCVFAYTYMYVSAAGLAIYVCAYMCACVRACMYHSVCVWHATCSMGHMYNIVATFCVHPPPFHPCTHYTSTHTHTHTHTYTPTSYMPSSHLLSLPSVLFSPISPPCPTQGSRLADVITTSGLGQLKVPQDNVHCMCTCLFIFCYSLSICFCMCLN